ELEHLLFESYAESSQKSQNVRALLEQKEKALRRSAEYLDQNFPAYAELARGQIVSADELQRGAGGAGPLLGEREGLIAYTQGKDALYAIAVTRTSIVLKKLDVSAEKLAGLVTALRKSVDLSGVTSAADLSVFDLGLAHQLYQTVFAPLEGSL